MMKFEDLLVQRREKKEKRLGVEEEVEELRQELEGHLQVKTVLQCALQGAVGSCPCLSSLPRKVQHVVEQVVMAEEEIVLLERKVDMLKLKLYREKELGQLLKPLNLTKHSFDLITEISCQNDEKPNKLSQDLLKCLISIYLKLNKAFLEGKGSSALIKHSLTSSRKSKSLLNTCSTPAAAPTLSFNDYASNLDPYGILLDTAHREIGSYKNFIQVSRSSLNTNHISACLPEMAKLRGMVHKLSSVDLTYLSYKHKLAFWINVYNICIMHAFLQHGLPSTEEEQLCLVNKASINVGGIVLNALAIEHFILRHPRDTTSHGFTDDKERVLRDAYGLGYPEPNVTFSLCRGSWSSPALRIYTADEVVNELEKAKVEYLEASVGVTSKKKIVVPKLMQWHMKDFANDMESLVEWIYSQLPNSNSPLKRSMMNICLTNNRKSKMIQVQPYASEFRYLLPL